MNKTTSRQLVEQLVNEGSLGPFVVAVHDEDYVELSFCSSPEEAEAEAKENPSYLALAITDQKGFGVGERWYGATKANTLKAGRAKPVGRYCVITSSPDYIDFSFCATEQEVMTEFEAAVAGEEINAVQITDPKAFGFSSEPFGCDVLASTAER